MASNGETVQLPLHPLAVTRQPQPQPSNPSQCRSPKRKGKKSRRAIINRTVHNPHIQSLLNAEVFGDVSGWLVVPSTPGPGTEGNTTTNSSIATASSANSGGSVTRNMDGHDGEPLTMENIQRLGIMNRTDAAVTERLMRRSDMVRTYYESLMNLGAAEMSPSVENIDRDPWGPVNMYSRSLELNGVGGWLNHAHRE